MLITPVTTGVPPKIGTQLNVRVITFATDATTCSTYYEILTDEGERIAEGNIDLTEAQFAAWGQDNEYIENIVLNELGLTRLEK